MYLGLNALAFLFTIIACFMLSYRIIGGWQLLSEFGVSVTRRIALLTSF
jgi:hypothetical protein